MKVLAGGRFNIIHSGHISFLEQAKSLGDKLVIIIASDKTIQKAHKTLIFPEGERKKMVESIRCVDKVIIGYPLKDQSGYEKIIREERPDIIALGYDQRKARQTVEKIVKKTGVSCKIVQLKKHKNYQTKKILKEF